MAFQDNDYVKAPYLQAGDSLKIIGTTSGFSVKVGNTGVIYGTNSGVLTMGEEGVPSSLPVLNINAQEINWNGKPLEEYFAAAGESPTELDELSTRVDNLQTQLATEVTELRATDADLTSDIKDLRLRSLGASADILQNTLNDYASNVCGIVIPVNLIQDEMNSFNTIRIGGIRNDVNCYVSIYHSTSTTPSIDNQFTLLHKDATLIDASGTDSQQASVDVRLSKNIALPTSGILLLLFATSSSYPSPSSTGINWIIDNSIEANLRLSVYSAGTSNPTASNGVWLFQKRPSPTFVTLVPDVQIVFTGYADDAASRVDTELSRKIGTLETGYTGLQGQLGTLEAAHTSLAGRVGTLETGYTGLQGRVGTLEVDYTNLHSNVEELHTYVDELQVHYMDLREDVTSVYSLVSDLTTDVEHIQASYMTEARTNSAITNYRIPGGDYNLGSLVHQLTVPVEPYVLEKGNFQLQFGASGMYVVTTDTVPDYVCTAMMSFTPSGIRSIVQDNDYSGMAELQLGSHSTVLAYNTKASDTFSGSAVTQLALSSYDIDMGLKTHYTPYGRYGFRMNAALPMYDADTTGMQVVYSSFGSGDEYASNSKLYMNGYSAALQVDAGDARTYLYLLPDELRLETLATAWDTSTSSHTVPTISIVHHLIQSALANQ